MTLQRLFFAFSLSLTLLLGACSPQDKTTADKSSERRTVSVADIASQAKGFTVGALMSNTVVYVFFDAQCPHCGHLWKASLPLHRKVKFVWIPVAWINPSSMSQGAALLSAANPTQAMSEHEALLIGGQGGMAASASISSDLEKAIKANSKLLNAYGAESVPFVVVQNATTGQTVTRGGAMTTAALATFIGVELPQ